MPWISFTLQVFHAIYFSGLQISNKMVKMYIQVFFRKKFSMFYAQNILLYGTVLKNLQFITSTKTSKLQINHFPPASKEQESLLSTRITTPPPPYFQ